MKKTLMSPEDLVLHMKERGIQFNIISHAEAISFLTNNNYYKKFSCYKKNYTYAPDKDGNKKYQQLEFAYLLELSVLDMRLRYLIMQMCLDIEHAVKIWVINECIKINDDGYAICSQFLKKYPDVAANTENHSSSPYCEELINCHKHRYPIWILLEVLSFGDLCKLYKWFNDNYIRKTPNTDIIFRVRELRNAAAHSHCLIRDLKSGNATPPPCVSNFVSSITTISPSARKSKLKNCFLCDFVSTLFFYDVIVKSEGSKNRIYKELSLLFNERMLRHKDYFTQNILVKSSYEFCKKVVDKIQKVE